jgi:HEAT repeat protein
MVRIWFVAFAGLVAAGCGSSNSAPAPAGTPTATTSTSSAQRPPAESSRPVAESPAPSVPTSLPGPLTKEQATLRDLMERYVVSDAQGALRPAEGAATELEKLDPKAAAVLPLLRDPSAPVRRGAAFYLLGKFDPAQADQVVAFAALLDDDDQTIRGFGLTAVKQMRAKDQLEALPRLTGMLAAMRETKPENRAAIARFIGGLKREAASAADALAGAAADDPDAKVRAACLAAIVQVAEPGACLAPLANGLGDSDPAVRLVAAARLQSFGPTAEPAAKQLAAALADTDQRVREKAATALIAIGAPAVESIVPQLEARNLEAKKLALAALAKIGPPAKAALPAIEKCKADADPDVKKLAEIAAQRIGS